jgi:Fe-S oxidoreductase
MEKIESNKTKCTLCGLCKTSCPAYKVLLNESISPRGKAILLKRDFPSKHFYLCTMCKACENACILSDIDLVEKIRRYRAELVDLGISTDANKRMIANIRQFGNPFGVVEKGKKVELFCC